MTRKATPRLQALGFILAILAASWIAAAAVFLLIDAVLDPPRQLTLVALLALSLLLFLAVAARRAGRPVPQRSAAAYAPVADMEPLYASLLPVVELLVAHGNQPAEGGFLNSPGGWYCRMTKTLDIDLVQRELDLPPSVSCSREHDAIGDRSTWASVIGPGAPSGAAGPRGGLPTEPGVEFEEIHGFRSPGEFERFVAWIETLVADGLMQETAVQDHLGGVAMTQERWFHGAGQTWRLVYPDPPFRGVFEPVASGELRRAHRRS